LASSSLGEGSFLDVSYSRFERVLSGTHFHGREDSN
jgi:hypothetical protein